MHAGCTDRALLALPRLQPVYIGLACYGLDRALVAVKKRLAQLGAGPPTKQKHRDFVDRSVARLEQELTPVKLHFRQNNKKIIGIYRAMQEFAGKHSGNEYLRQALYMTYLYYLKSILLLCNYRYKCTLIDPDKDLLTFPKEDSLDTLTNTTSLIYSYYFLKQEKFSLSLNELNKIKRTTHTITKQIFKSYLLVQLRDFQKARDVLSSSLTNMCSQMGVKLDYGIDKNMTMFDKESMLKFFICLFNYTCVLRHMLDRKAMFMIDVCLILARSYYEKHKGQDPNAEKMYALALKAKGTPMNDSDLSTFSKVFTRMQPLDDTSAMSDLYHTLVIDDNIEQSRSRSAHETMERTNVETQDESGLRSLSVDPRSLLFKSDLEPINSSFGYVAEEPYQMKRPLNRKPLKPLPGDNITIPIESETTRRLTLRNPAKKLNESKPAKKTNQSSLYDSVMKSKQAIMEVEAAHPQAKRDATYYIQKSLFNVGTKVYGKIIVRACRKAVTKKSAMYELELRKEDVCRIINKCCKQYLERQMYNRMKTSIIPHFFKYVYDRIIYKQVLHAVIAQRAFCCFYAQQDLVKRQVNSVILIADVLDSYKGRCENDRLVHLALKLQLIYRGNRARKELASDLANRQTITKWLRGEVNTKREELISESASCIKRILIYFTKRENTGTSSIAIQRRQEMLVAHLGHLAKGYVVRKKVEYEMAQAMLIAGVVKAGDVRNNLHSVVNSLLLYGKDLIKWVKTVLSIQIATAQKYSAEKICRCVSKLMYYNKWKNYDDAVFRIKAVCLSRHIPHLAANVLSLQSACRMLLCMQKFKGVKDDVKTLQRFVRSRKCFIPSIRILKALVGHRIEIIRRCKRDAAAERIRCFALTVSQLRETKTIKLAAISIQGCFRELRRRRNTISASLLQLQRVAKGMLGRMTANRMQSVMIPLGSEEPTQEDRRYLVRCLSHIRQREHGMEIVVIQAFMKSVLVPRIGLIRNRIIAFQASCRAHILMSKLGTLRRFAHTLKCHQTIRYASVSKALITKLWHITDPKALVPKYMDTIAFTCIAYLERKRIVQMATLVRSVSIYITSSREQRRESSQEHIASWVRTMREHRQSVEKTRAALVIQHNMRPKSELKLVKPLKYFKQYICNRRIGHVLHGIHVLQSSFRSRKLKEWHQNATKLSTTLWRIHNHEEKPTILAEWLQHKYRDTHRENTQLGPMLYHLRKPVVPQLHMRKQVSLKYKETMETIQCWVQNILKRRKQHNEIRLALLLQRHYRTQEPIRVVPVLARFVSAFKPHLTATDAARLIHDFVILRYKAKEETIIDSLDETESTIPEFDIANNETQQEVPQQIPPQIVIRTLSRENSWAQCVKNMLQEEKDSPSEEETVQLMNGFSQLRQLLNTKNREDIDQDVLNSSFIRRLIEADSLERELDMLGGTKTGTLDSYSVYDESTSGTIPPDDPQVPQVQMVPGRSRRMKRASNLNTFVEQPPVVGQGEELVEIPDIDSADETEPINELLVFDSESDDVLVLPKDTKLYKHIVSHSRGASPIRARSGPKKTHTAFPGLSLDDSVPVPQLEHQIGRLNTRLAHSSNRFAVHNRRSMIRINVTNQPNHKQANLASQLELQIDDDTDAQVTFVSTTYRGDETTA